MNPVSNPSLHPVIAEKPAYHVIGTKERHELNPDGPMPTIIKQWESFMQHIQEIPGRRQSDPTLGVCIFDPTTGLFEYMSGAVVHEENTEVPTGMEQMTLAPQTYAIFTHRGPIADLGQTYGAIQRWLHSSSQNVRAKAPEFEYYDHRYMSVEAAESEFDIYIPITRK